tara:strand:- start:3722 stop:4285 length:564 start_codon:yes stop_codon:yes gene_type:complete
MSPGPSMVVVINNAIFKNRYHGILTAIGHGIGIGIYALFAVVGIGLVIKTNLEIFNFIKVLSILFLLYLGIKSVLSKNQINFDQKKLRGGAISFFQGLSISILNPKIFIWFVAIYSQFMSENNDIVFDSYLVLTAGIVDATWYIILTILVTSGAALEFFKKRSVVLNKVIGILFILISGFLLLELII